MSHEPGYQLVQIDENTFEIRLDNLTRASWQNKNFWQELTMTTGTDHIKVVTHSDSAKHILNRMVQSLNTLYWHTREVDAAKFTQPKTGKEKVR